MPQATTQIDADGKKTVRVSDGYLVPAPLVHTILWGIVISIISIGGYMAMWYVNDRLWKQNINNRVTMMEGHDFRVKAEIDNLRTKYNKHVDWARKAERDGEMRIRELEREHKE